MAKSLEISKKRGPDRSSEPKTLSFGEKIAKICPADPEIICLREIVKDKKKKEINASKIYSPVSNLAERAKKTIDVMQLCSKFDCCHQGCSQGLYWRIAGMRSEKRLRCFPVSSIKIRELCSSPKFEIWHSNL